MSLVNDLLEKPPNLTIASRYTAMNGVLYLGTGALLIAWPEAVQIIFRDAAFVGREESLMRVIGLTILVIGCSTYSAAAPARDRLSPLLSSTD